MVTKLPKPQLVATDLKIPAPAPPAPVDGFDKTLARHGDRTLVYHNAGWYGRFVYEIDAGGGDPRIVCQSGLTTFAAFLDSDHIAVAAGDETWVLRRGPVGYELASGVEKTSGPIAPLTNDMIAIGFPDEELRLLAFRDGYLRLFKGKVKPPKGAPDGDRDMTVHAGRVFAASSSDALELVDWNMAADWSPSADWDKAVKKLIKTSGVPVSVVAPPPAPPAADGVTVQADGSRWRFVGEKTVAVEVGGSWQELSLPEGISGAHYVEVPERERRYLVERRVHGAVDALRGVAWLTTAGEKLLRADLATGACEIAAAVPASKQTIGVFPQPDGRVVVVAEDVTSVIRPDNPDQRLDNRGGRYAAAVSLGGPLIAVTSVHPDRNKDGLPGGRVELLEIGPFPRSWLGWQLPLYAPALVFDGRTLIAHQGDRALAFELEAALAWFPQFAGRSDVPALPAK